MTEPQITAVCTVTDPEERQRRLNQVYGLLFELAREKQLAEQQRSDQQARILTDGAAGTDERCANHGQDCGNG